MSLARSRLLVFATLRAAAPLSTDGIVTRTGCAEAEVQSVLDDALTAGLVEHRGGTLPGWLLTPTGRVEVSRLLADEVDRAEVRPGLEAMYRRFADLNGRLLGLCTDWQLRPLDGERVVNDHQDPAYDARVVERLEALHRTAAESCAELGALLDRFRRYLPRLERALDHVRLGDHAWFASPTVDSYHTVWFELHEDLLATLGIDRATEGAAS